MKVYFVSDFFWPGIGGLERSIGYLADALSRWHTVEVLTLCADRPCEDRHTVAVRRFAAGPAGPYAEMLSYLRRDQASPKAVCFFGFSDRWTDRHLEFLSAVRREVAACVTFKVPSLHEFSHYITTPRRRECLLGADCIFCLNPAIREELASAGMPPGKLKDLRNGVPCDRFQPALPGKKAMLRTRFGLSDGTTFVFAGRFAARKRVGLLVEAVRRVTQVNLILVGYFDQRFDEGSCFTLLPNDPIRWFHATDDVVPYYQAADFFLSASVAEGMPNALLEAMSCGLPAVVSDIPGHREIVRPDACGWFFRPDDPVDLENVIRRALLRREELPTMSRQARAVVTGGYDIRFVAETYRQQIQKCLHG